MTPAATNSSDAHPKVQRSLFRRLLPHPGLSALLLGLWLALHNNFEPGYWLVGCIFAAVIPIYTSNFWPDRPRIRAPLTLLSFLGVFVWDIIVANVQVAYLVLFRSPSSLRSHWICIPLELRSPDAITVLCGTISLTPGTISSDLSADGRSLLVHCLDVEDPAAEAQKIKDRYESRLKVIFP